jgi:phage virion morphogenesis protein
MDDLIQLEHWAGALLARLEPPARRRLTRAIALDLRRRQQQRIAAQRNPDGSPFAPRKRQADPPRRKPGHGLRSKSGRVRKKAAAMFQRLRTARFLRPQSDAAQAAVGFAGRVARIARVHQYGERDRVSPRGPVVQYPARRLLGLSAADIEHIRQTLLDHLRG